MGRPREHGERTRDALLEVAARILGSEGAGAVTVRRVAAEAGTSTRAVYSLFGDKEGLLRALFHEAADVMRRHHEGVPVLGDPVAEMRLLAEAYRAGAWAQPNLYDLFLGGAAPGFTPTQEDMDLAFRSFERVLATLGRCADAGELGGREPEAVGRQLWSLVHGLTSLELHGFLGDRVEAGARWQDAFDAAMAGYALRS